MPYIVGYLIIVGALAFVWSRIFQRVGWPPLLALVALVLPVNLIILLVLAFSRWPVEDRVAGLEREVARLRGAG